MFRKRLAVFPALATSKLIPRITEIFILVRMKACFIQKMMENRGKDLIRVVY